MSASAPLLSARPGTPLSGRVEAPGDKSISHRSLILGGLAEGETRVTGLLEGADVLATAGAVRALGAEVEQLGRGEWRIVGRGGFRSPDGVLDCGNSGTGCRLLMGAAAGFELVATFDGDGSLRSRPMKRVMGPLEQMGARFDGDGDRLPLTLHGGRLKGIDYTLPVASAQVKSAVLLAGLNADGATVVREPEPTRDHTERMLKGFGADIRVEEVEGVRVSILRHSRLKGISLHVPGDPSSAAFPIVAALITPGSEVTVEGLLLNPLRIGLLETLGDMGADLSVTNVRAEGGEQVADVTARYSQLTGVRVPSERAPSMIDEYPILGVAAAFAEGDTVMEGIGELRVKESDRIALMAAGLEACGVDVEEEPEGLIVHGTGRAPRGGAVVETHGDHRIAMSHLVLGLAAEAGVSVDEPGMIATSFPNFVALMRSLGAAVDETAA